MNNQTEVTIIEVRNAIIDAMVEAALASTIDNRMVDEINELRTNGFNTRDLFDIRGQVFVLERWDLLPLAERVAFFDSIA